MAIRGGRVGQIVMSSTRMPCSLTITQSGSQDMSTQTNVAFGAQERLSLLRQYPSRTLYPTCSSPGASIQRTAQNEEGGGDFQDSHVLFCQQEALFFFQFHPDPFPDIAAWVCPGEICNTNSLPQCGTIHSRVLESRTRAGSRPGFWLPGAVRAAQCLHHWAH